MSKLNQPKRYVNGRYGLDQHESGEWVMWSDYAALAAENERLRKAGDALAELVESEIKHTWNRNSKLKAWLAAKEGRDAK